MRLQDELNALQLQGGAADDFRPPPQSKGSGPRLFCGHVPKVRLLSLFIEGVSTPCPHLHTSVHQLSLRRLPCVHPLSPAINPYSILPTPAVRHIAHTFYPPFIFLHLQEATEDIVKAHFSRWGVVTDVYFPRHKKTLKRRPFCFVTFANKESAQRALAESPLSICGIPIKNLTMVEDRDKYYKDKQEAAQQALLTALNSMGASGALAPEQVNNIAALLAMEGVSSEAVLAMLLQPQTIPQAHPQLQQLQHQHQQFAPSPQHHRPTPNPAALGLSPAGLAPIQFPAPPPGAGMRFSAPAGSGVSAPSPNLFFSQQQQTALHHHHHQMPHPSQQQQPTLGTFGTMRSASGPLPSTAVAPFGSGSSKEGSISSLSSVSDWYSTTSSGRTSLDFGSASGHFFGPSAPGSSGSGGGSGGGRRNSFDGANLQFRQQLGAAPPLPTTQPHWMHAAALSMSQPQLQQQSAAAMLQSGAMHPQNVSVSVSAPVSAASSGSGATPPSSDPGGLLSSVAAHLPPIRENWPSIIGRSGAGAGATADGFDPAALMSAFAAAQQQQQQQQFATGSTTAAMQATTMSGVTPPPRPSHLHPLAAVEVPFTGTASAPTVLPVGLPDSSGSEQDTVIVSSRNSSGAMESNGMATATTTSVGGVGVGGGVGPPGAGAWLNTLQQQLALQQQQQQQQQQGGSRYASGGVVGTGGVQSLRTTGLTSVSPSGGTLSPPQPTQSPTTSV